jgi:adenylate cyclase
MQALRSRGTRLQVWDMFFAEPAPGDAEIDALIAAPSRDIMWGQVLVVDPQIQVPPRTGVVYPSSDAPSLCAANFSIAGHFGVSPTLHPTLVGHLSATPDADGRLRRLPAVLCDADKRYPQLTIAAAQALEPGVPWSVRPGRFPFGPAQWLERGRFQFALDDNGLLPIPYQRPHTAWPAVSASRLLDPNASLLPLQGQIVVVGATALGLGDTVSTPYHPHAPGASVHAELIGAALDHEWTVPPRSPAFIAALIAVLFAVVLLPLPQPRRRPVWISAGLALALTAPILVAIVGRFAGIMLPVAAPVLALMCFGVGLLMAQADAEKSHAQQLAAHLESFLPRGLAMEIAHQTPSGESLGKPCQGILLALRVVGLERWTGAVDTLQALALVHAISTLAERAASRKGGALEHVQGETLLLAWPQADAAGVRAAIAATREVFQALEPVLIHNESLRFPLGVRAALESGSFLLGLAGSRASRRPVLLGPVADTVLAMLMLCDELASPLLVGPQAAQSVQGDPDSPLHSLGQFLLPDQADPKPLFRAEI